MRGTVVHQISAIPSKRVRATLRCLAAHQLQLLPHQAATTVPFTVHKNSQLILAGPLRLQSDPTITLHYILPIVAIARLIPCSLDVAATARSGQPSAPRRPDSRLLSVCSSRRSPQTPPVAPPPHPPLDRPRSRA